MQKPIRPRWILQALVDAERERIAPGQPIAVTVSPVDEKIERIEDCPGVGYAPWRCTYVVPPDEAHALSLVPVIDEAVGRWREMLFVGVTFPD
jgi:hypothetical protein